MLRSGISFPFPTFYHHFATPKLLPFDSNFAPSLELFSKIFLQFSTVLPPLMLCPEIFPTLWKTWVAYGLPHVFIRCFLPFVSPPAFHLLLSSFRFTSCLSFVTFFLLFHLWPCIRSGILCVTVFMSFHLWLALFQQNLFFQDDHSTFYFYQHAATCSHLQPLTATHSRSHLRPFAATCSHSSGHKWPRVAASGRSSQFQASGRKWPLQKIASEWPQMALSGRSICFQASGRKWPLSAKSISTLKATPWKSMKILWKLMIHDETYKITKSLNDPNLSLRGPW